MDATCLNGHDKATYMNERGVCSQCKADYFVKIRKHTPKTLKGNNNERSDR